MVLLFVGVRHKAFVHSVTTILHFFSVQSICLALGTFAVFWQYSICTAYENYSKHRKGEFTGIVT